MSDQSKPRDEYRHAYLYIDYSDNARQHFYDNPYAIQSKFGADPQFEFIDVTAYDALNAETDFWQNEAEGYAKGCDDLQGVVEKLDKEADSLRAEIQELKGRRKCSHEYMYINGRCSGCGDPAP